MDRRSGRIQAHPVLWSAATVRKRRTTDESVFAYMRRYLGRMVVVLTLVTPLMVVVADQLAPRRPQRDTENLVTIAMAAANTSAANVSASSRVAARSSTGGRAILTQEQEARLSAEARLPSGAFCLPDGNRLGVW
ncbi:MAG: hypothetical protein AB7P40_32200, partial [Chloroflexota bacterium]